MPGNILNTFIFMISDSCFLIRKIEAIMVAGLWGYIKRDDENNSYNLLRVSLMPGTIVSIVII